ncbi:hypothetical protein HFZ78_20075 [Priestia megaterium]|uniref:Uncharacterized protein n=1 Tax=Priestia megaterium TaxID=1404 RepID=A0A6H1P5H3_PRIMG|nr:hypothetical protein [Priestia megaterium]QIZ08715.1 hypothetical protein HFZ78_20075 [Priestia megaterium]
MSNKNQWLLNVPMVLLVWLTLPFLGLHNIKKFLPASIFIVIIENLFAQIGKKRKWWVFYKKNPYISVALPFYIGPFLVGSMWILKWTYGNFKRFISLNAIVDGMFTILMMGLLKKLKIVTLVRFNKIQFFLYMFLKSFLLYGFQYLIEKRKNY